MAGCFFMRVVLLRKQRWCGKPYTATRGTYSPYQMLNKAISVFKMYSGYRPTDG